MPDLRATGRPDSRCHRCHPRHDQHDAGPAQGPPLPTTPPACSTPRAPPSATRSTPNTRPAQRPCPTTCAARSRPSTRWWPAGLEGAGRARRGGRRRDRHPGRDGAHRALRSSSPAATRTWPTGERAHHHHRHHERQACATWPGVRPNSACPPALMVDYQALVGDTVDNVPGVTKVGPKTAAKWLEEYGSLDALVPTPAGHQGRGGQEPAQGDWTGCPLEPPAAHHQDRLRPGRLGPRPACAGRHHASAPDRRGLLAVLRKVRLQGPGAALKGAAPAARPRPPSPCPAKAATCSPTIPPAPWPRKPSTARWCTTPSSTGPTLTTGWSACTKAAGGARHRDHLPRRDARRNRRHQLQRAARRGRLHPAGPRRARCPRATAAG
jgi:hypothetical protein